MITANVDRAGCCDQCPMLFRRGGDKATCLHPSSLPAGADDYHGGRRFRVDPNDVPDWCPLTSTPVLVMFDRRKRDDRGEDSGHEIETIELPTVADAWPLLVEMVAACAALGAACGGADYDAALRRNGVAIEAVRAWARARIAKGVP